MKTKIIWRSRAFPVCVAPVFLMLAMVLTLTAPPEISWAQEHEAAGFCSGISQISPDECDALAALHKETDGDEWINNNGWLKHSNPCQWRGVTCSEQHVTKLILHNNNLTGSIPPDLGKLIHLEELDLSGNRISGAIPSELSLLKNI